MAEVLLPKNFIVICVWCAYFLWHRQTFPLQNTKDSLSLSLALALLNLFSKEKIGVLSSEDDLKRKERTKTKKNYVVLLWMLSKCNGCLGKNTCHCFANLLFNILVTRKQNVIVLVISSKIIIKSFFIVEFQAIDRLKVSQKLLLSIPYKIQMCDEWLINYQEKIPTKNNSESFFINRTK